MIKDIKAKIPSKKKASDDDIDESEGHESTDPGISAADKTGQTDIGELEDLDEKPKSIIDKIRAKFIPQKKKTSEDVDDEDADKKPAKKKINPIVLVVVVGALAALFLIEDEPAAPPAGTAAEAPADSPAKKAKAKAAAEKAAKEAAATGGETPKEGEPSAEPSTETPAPSETVAEAPVPSETAPTEPVTEAATEPVPADPVIDAPVVDVPVTEAPVAEAPIEAPAEPVIEEPIQVEPVVTDTPTETPSGPEVIPDAPPKSVDSVDGTVVSDDSSMTDKILEDLEKQVKKDLPKEVKKEYVSPPEYEYVGRGLVYNCAGKHWACVDGPSYKVCEDNHSSVTFQKKKVECYPFNVYESTQGCTAMQNRVVSSNAKTDFCKGN